MEAMQWEKAIEVLTKGKETFPDNRKLKTNLEYAWMKRAKPDLDSENWKAAANIYRKAAEALPRSSKIRNNLRFCESKLKAAGE